MIRLNSFWLSIGVIAIVFILLFGGINNPADVVQRKVYKADITVVGTYTKDLIFPDTLKVENIYVDIQPDDLIYLNTADKPASIFETNNAKLNIIILDPNSQKIYDREIEFQVDEKTWSISFTVHGLTEEGEYQITVETYLLDIAGIWLHKDTYTTTFNIP